MRDRFDLARNVFVYSWFVYEFATLAEQHALAIVEDIIRIRLLEGVTDQKQRQKIEGFGLREVLTAALTRKWIQHEDFSMPSAYEGGRNISILFDFLLNVRNDLMHGRWHLLPEGTLNFAFVRGRAEIGCIVPGS